MSGTPSPGYYSCKSVLSAKHSQSLYLLNQAAGRVLTVGHVVLVPKGGGQLCRVPGLGLHVMVCARTTSIKYLDEVFTM